MTGFVTVYVTAADVAEATTIGRGLVAARLAACANIVEGVKSIYWWGGNIEEAGEAILLLKTRAVLVPRLTAWIRERHSYDCPAIAAWPIAQGNPEYLAWIEAETIAPDGPA